MPTYFHNPENALKRAQEFCEVGKYDEALECLYDALKNRKSRMMKQIHENIIDKFLELCVELKKSQMAKDGLYSYRNLCQGVNIKSWEDAVCKYIKLAEDKIEVAVNLSFIHSFQSVILDIDDLDQDVTPETLLKSVSSECAQDRSERIILLPWIKFLWECYRNSLDLLRNTQTYRLYHTVAQNTFKFCVKFSRRSELRKLCNILKIHAMHIQKRQAYLKIDDVEVHLMHLETGFVELDSALHMELWQDAFKAIEDIHAVINISKKFQQSKILAHYYDKISCIFWKGGEYLFHAAANLRYFLLVRDQKKNLSSDDIIKLSSRVMLSILSVPPAPISSTIDFIAETDVTAIDRKNRSLSSLLDLSKCPTRTALVKDAIHLGIIQYLPDVLKNLFQTMEIESDKTFPSISKAIDFIQNWSDCELDQYIPLLHKIVVIKLLPVLSNMYVNIKMSKLLNFTGITEMSDLEYILLDSARRYEISLRIDHKNMCVHFPDSFRIFQNEKLWDESFTKDSLPDTHLNSLMYTHSALKNVVAEIQPELRINENKLLAEKLARRYHREKEEYRRNLLQRKTIIEKHKENMEQLRLKKEEDERKLMAEKLLQYEAAEKERLLKETEELKLQRLQREQEEIKRKLLIEKMETFKKTVLGSQIVENLEFEKFDNLDPQILFSKQIEQLNKERKELSSKLKRQERNLDHLERAKRVEEVPLLIDEHERFKEIDIAQWKEDERNKIEMAHKKRKQDVHKNNRVLEIKKDLQNFIKLVKMNKSEAYHGKMVQFIETLEIEREKRLKKRTEERKQRRKDEWIKQNQKRKKENELKKRDLCHIEGEKARSILKRDIKVRTIKASASPQKRAVTNIEDEEIFRENISNSDKAISPCSHTKKGHSSSGETTEGIHLPRDIFYYKRVYKTRTMETERTEMYEKKTSISKFSDELSSTKSKRDNDKNFDIATTQRIRRNAFERNDETLLTWRTPWSQKSQYGHFSKEGGIPQRTITIMRRDDGSRTTSIEKDKSTFTAQKEKSHKSEKEKSDAYSCTPWAKLRRKDADK